MSSRDAILHRIRTSLSAGPAVPPPPVPEVWPRENPDRQTMAARFSEELTKIFGEVVRCDSMAAAQKRLAELVETAGWASLGALDRPLTREAVAGLVPERVRWVDDAWTRHDIAQLPAGLIAADALVADSGTCAIACQSAHARLMCYLPPACVVVARGEQLAEHSPAAWAGDRPPLGRSAGPRRNCPRDRSQPHGGHRKDPHSRRPRPEAAGGAPGGLGRIHSHMSRFRCHAHACRGHVAVLGDLQTCPRQAWAWHPANMPTASVGMAPGFPRSLPMASSLENSPTRPLSGGPVRIKFPGGPVDGNYLPPVRQGVRCHTVSI